MMLYKGNVIENFQTWSSRGVCHISFNHMKRPYNILDTKTLDELDYILDNILKPEIHKGIIFRSSKGSFVVGANVKDFVSAHDSQDEDIDKILKKGQDIFNKIEDLNIPTVAIMGGITMGGGLELALACTSRILIKNPVPEDTKYTTYQLTKLALPEVKLGILPSWGGTTRLPRIISPVKAMELICSGRNVGESEALKIGLVDEIIDRHEAEDCAHSIINTIDYRSIQASKCVPPNVSRLKMMLAGMYIKWVIGRKQKKMFGDKNKYPSPYKALDTFKRCLTMHRGMSQLEEREAFIPLVRSNECKELVGKFLSGERG
jgi:3-hydroxyacyl-CoA dehydrogenase/enoyl-CoA hydratase/3-hydroxybutyryl-CoA epimerase/enoyl-CoA isomerase